MISLALYLSLVISLDTYAFDCKNIKCRIGGSYLQEKSLPLLFLEIHEVVMVRAENENLREL